MKNELFSAIGAAVAGLLISYFVCNMFVGEIEDVSFSTVDPSLSTDLVDPNPEVFNYKALNPTVEVYVGDCTEYDENGRCIEQVTSEEVFDGSSH